MRYVSVVYARLFSFTSVGYHILCHYLDTIKVSCSNVDCELIVSWSNILLFFPCTGFAKLNSLAAFVFSSRYSQSFDALHKNFSFYQQTIASLLQVTEGERLTLTLWFTRDSSFDEDRSEITSQCMYTCIVHIHFNENDTRGNQSKSQPSSKLLKSHLNVDVADCTERVSCYVNNKMLQNYHCIHTSITQV